MKLQSKHTGRVLTKYTIRALEGVDADKGNEKIVLIDDESHDKWVYYTLAEFNDEWEDYEEPKDFWYIKPNGCIDRDNLGSIECDIPKEYYNKMVEIGNKFKTEEEAEKAVEKLKAWKRLRDKGFKFKGGDDACISYEFPIEKWNSELEKDFELLFGGIK